jgi:hypothetical protein
MKYTDILIHYDLLIDSYELRMTTGIVKTVSFIANGQPVYTDVYVNGKAMTEERAVNLFDEVVGTDMQSIKVVSKNILSRKQRETRRLQDRIVNEYEEEDFEEISRYDNHIVSELLPVLSISLYDLLVPDELDVLNNGAKYPFSKIA